MNGLSASAATDAQADQRLRAMREALHGEVVELRVLTPVPPSAVGGVWSGVGIRVSGA